MSKEISPTPSQLDDLTIPDWVNSGHPSAKLDVPRWVNPDHSSVESTLGHSASEELPRQPRLTSAQYDLLAPRRVEAIKSSLELSKKVGVYALLGVAAIGITAGVYLLDRATTTTECRDGRVDQGGSVVGTVQEVVADAGWQLPFSTEAVAAAHDAAREIDGSVHPGDSVKVCYTESLLPFSGHVTAKVTQK